MKNCKIICCLLVLTISYLSNNKTYVHADQLFDGGGYTVDYNTNVNVPMPSDPTPSTYYGSNSGSQSSTTTYTKSKSNTYTNHSSGSSLLTPQMTTDIVNSVYNQIQAQAKQKALEAQRQAEEKKKQEEAKKKKEAQDWLKDYNVTPKVDISDLKKYDPLSPKLEPSYVPPVGQSENENTGIKIPKLQTNTKQISNVSQNNSSEQFHPAKTEGELRELYFNADREIMQCASGKKECSPEYVKSLQMKRLTAEQGLTINYNYKEVNGQFIKKP